MSATTSRRPREANTSSKPGSGRRSRMTPRVEPLMDETWGFDEPIDVSVDRPSR